MGVPSRSLTALVLSCAFLGAPALGRQSTPQDEPPPRPRYQYYRWAEDWSVLAGREADTDPFDPLKYVPLSADGEFWASFGGRMRARVEHFENFGFGAGAGAPGANDDTYVLTRAFLHGDLHLGPRLRAFAEIKTAQVSDRDLPGGRRASDLDTFALQQAFVDVTLPLGDGSLRLRPGRQGLRLGAGRLVAPAPWSNTTRTWDGASAVFESGSFSATALALQFAPVRKTQSNDPDHDQPFYGLYTTWKEGQRGCDLYWLGIEREGSAFNGSVGSEQRHTFGSRGWAPLSETLRLELEGAYQTGEVDQADIRAWFVASKLDWKPAGRAGFFAGFDWASGDDEPGGDVETFQPLFPMGHGYYGFADVVGRLNAIDAQLGATWAAREDLSLRIANHAFWLASDDDALYAPNGSASRPSGSFASREIGYELDLSAVWRAATHVDALLGYSHFFAGAAVRDSGPGSDLDFLYLSLTYTF